MAIEPSDDLRRFLLVLTGEQFPITNEDHLFALGELMSQAGDDIDRSAATFVNGARTFRQGVVGESDLAFVDRMERMVRTDPGYIPLAAKYVHRMGHAYRDTGTQIQYAKLMIIASLIELLLELLAALAMAWINPMAAIATRLLSERLMRLLFETLAGRILQQVVIGQVIGIGMQVLMDTIVQGLQMGMGDRDHWDVNSTISAVEVGSLGGAVGMGTGGALHGVGHLLGKHGIDNFVARVVKSEAFQELSNEALSEYLTEGLYNVMTGQDWGNATGLAALGAGLNSGLVGMAGTHLGNHLREHATTSRADEREAAVRAAEERYGVPAEMDPNGDGFVDDGRLPVYQDTAPAYEEVESPPAYSEEPPQRSRGIRNTSGSSRSGSAASSGSSGARPSSRSTSSIGGLGGSHSVSGPSEVTIEPGHDATSDAPAPVTSMPTVPGMAGSVPTGLGSTGLGSTGLGSTGSVQGGAASAGAVPGGSAAGGPGKVDPAALSPGGAKSGPLSGPSAVSGSDLRSGSAAQGGSAGQGGSVARAGSTGQGSNGQGTAGEGRAETRTPGKVSEPVAQQTIDGLRSAAPARVANTAAYDVVHAGDVTGTVPEVVADSYRQAGLDVPATEVTRPSFLDIAGPIAYHYRTLTDGDRTVHDFTIRIHLDPRDPVATANRRDVERRAAAAVHETYNRGYRIGDGQLHVNVEFVDRPEDADTTIKLYGAGDHPTTQTEWSVTTEDRLFPHEIGHYLGLDDGNVDDGNLDTGGSPRVFNSTPESAHVRPGGSVMTDAVPVLDARDVDRIETVKQTVLGPDRGALGPQRAAPRVEHRGALGTRPAPAPIPTTGETRNARFAALVGNPAPIATDEFPALRKGLIEADARVGIVVNMMAPARDVHLLPEVIRRITEGLPDGEPVTFVVGVNTMETRVDPALREAVRNAVAAAADSPWPVAVVGHAVGKKNKAFPYGKARNAVLTSASTRDAINAHVAGGRYPYVSFQDFDTAARSLKDGTHIFRRFDALTAIENDDAVRPLMFAGGYRVGDDAKLIEDTVDRLAGERAKLAAKQERTPADETALKIADLDRRLRELGDEEGAAAFVTEFKQRIAEDMFAREQQGRIHPLVPYAPEPNLFVDGLLVNGDDTIRFGENGAEFAELGEAVHRAYGTELIDGYRAARFQEKFDRALTAATEERGSLTPEEIEEVRGRIEVTPDEVAELMAGPLRADSQNNRHPLRGRGILVDYVGSAMPTDLSRLAAMYAQGKGVPQSHSYQLKSVQARLVKSAGAEKKAAGIDLDAYRETYAGELSPYARPAVPGRGLADVLTDAQKAQLGDDPRNMLAPAVSHPFTVDGQEGRAGLPVDHWLTAAQGLALSHPRDVTRQQFLAAADVVGQIDVAGQTGAPIPVRESSLFGAMAADLGKPAERLRGELLAAMSEIGDADLEKVVTRRLERPFDYGHLVQAAIAPASRERTSSARERVEEERLRGASDVVLQLAAVTWGVNIEVTGVGPERFGTEPPGAWTVTVERYFENNQVAFRVLGRDRPSPLGQGIAEGGRADGRTPGRVSSVVPREMIDGLRESVPARRAHTAAYDVVHSGEITGTVPPVVARSYRAADLVPPAATVTRPVLENVAGPIAYHYRSITAGDATVHDFTVKIRLVPAEGVTPADVESVKTRARAAIDRVFNNGFRIGDGQFHANVEFVETGEDTTIGLYGDGAPPMTQTRWSVHADDVSFAHEYGHYLGLDDENVDTHLTGALGQPVQRFFNRNAAAPHVHADNSVMTSALPEDGPELFERHLDRIAGLRETVLGPDRGPLGPQKRPGTEHDPELPTRPAPPPATAVMRNRLFQETVGTPPAVAAAGFRDTRDRLIRDRAGLGVVVNVMVAAHEVGQLVGVLRAIAGGLPPEQARVTFVVGVNTMGDSAHDAALTAAVQTAANAVAGAPWPIAVVGHAVGKSGRGGFPYGRARNAVLTSDPTRDAINRYVDQRRYPYVSFQDFDTASRATADGTHIFQRFIQVTSGGPGRPLRPLMFAGGYRVGAHDQLIKDTIGRLETAKKAEAPGSDAARTIDGALRRLRDEKQAAEFVAEFEQRIGEDMFARDQQGRIHPLLPYAPEPNLFVDGLLVNTDNTIRFGETGAEFPALGEALHRAYGAELIGDYRAEALAMPAQERPPYAEMLTGRLPADSQNNRHPVRGLGIMVDYVGSAMPTDLSRIAAEYIRNGTVPQSHVGLGSVSTRLLRNGDRNSRANLMAYRKTGIGALSQYAGPAVYRRRAVQIGRNTDGSLSLDRPALLDGAGADRPYASLHDVLTPSQKAQLGADPRNTLGPAVSYQLPDGSATVGLPAVQKLEAARQLALSHPEGVTKQQFMALAGTVDRARGDRGPIPIRSTSIFAALAGLGGMKPGKLRRDLLDAMRGADQTMLAEVVRTRVSRPFEYGHLVQAAVAPGPALVRSGPWTAGPDEVLPSPAVEHDPDAVLTEAEQVRALQTEADAEQAADRRELDSLVAASDVVLRIAARVWGVRIRVTGLGEGTFQAGPASAPTVEVRRSFAENRIVFERTQPLPELQQRQQQGQQQGRRQQGQQQQGRQQQGRQPQRQGQGQAFRRSPYGQGPAAGGRVDTRTPAKVADPVAREVIDGLRESVPARRANTTAYDVVHGGEVTGTVPSRVARSYRAAGLDVPTAEVTRPVLTSVAGPIGYHYRSIVVDGRTVHDFTVKIRLEAKDDVARASLDGVRQRAREAVDLVFNNGFRMGDGQFNAHLEFVESGEDIAVELHGVNPPPMTQTQWPVEANGLEYAHEFGHSLGLGDQNQDTDHPFVRVFNRDGTSAHVYDDRSIMTTADVDLFERHIEELAAVRDLVLGPDRGSLGPENDPAPARRDELVTRPAPVVPGETENYYPNPAWQQFAGPVGVLDAAGHLALRDTLIDAAAPAGFVVNMMVPESGVGDVRAAIEAIEAGRPSTISVSYVIGVNTMRALQADQSLTVAVLRAANSVQDLGVPIAVTGHAVGSSKGFPFGRARNALMTSPATRLAVSASVAYGFYPYVSFQDFDFGARTLADNQTHIFSRFAELTGNLGGHVPSRPLMVAGGYRVGGDTGRMLAEAWRQLNEELQQPGLTGARRAQVQKGLETLTDPGRRTAFLEKFTRDVEEDMQSRDRQRGIHPLLPYAPEPNLFVDGLLILGDPTIRFSDGAAEYTHLAETLHRSYGTDLIWEHLRRVAEEDGNPVLSQPPAATNWMGTVPPVEHPSAEAAEITVNERVVTRTMRDSQNNSHPKRGRAFLVDFAGSAVATDLSRLAAASLSGRGLLQSHDNMAGVLDRFVGVDRVNLPPGMSLNAKDAKKGMQLVDYAKNGAKQAAPYAVRPAEGASQKPIGELLGADALRRLGDQPHNTLNPAISYVDAVTGITIGVPPDQKVLAADRLAESDSVSSTRQLFANAAAISAGVRVRPESLYAVLATLSPQSGPAEAIRAMVLATGAGELSNNAVSRLVPMLGAGGAGHFVQVAIAAATPVTDLSRMTAVPDSPIPAGTWRWTDDTATPYDGVPDGAPAADGPQWQLREAALLRGASDAVLTAAAEALRIRIEVVDGGRTHAFMPQRVTNVRTVQITRDVVNNRVVFGRPSPYGQGPVEGGRADSRTPAKVSTVVPREVIDGLRESVPARRADTTAYDVVPAGEVAGAVPSRVVESYRAAGLEVPAAEATRQAFASVAGPIAYHYRSIAVGEQTVHDFTVKVRLKPADGVGAADVASVEQRARAAVDRVFNNGYRFEGGQFNANVEFVDSGEDTVIELHAGDVPMTQTRWSVGADDAEFAHEFLHYLAVDDENVDGVRFFNLTATSAHVRGGRSLMTTADPVLLQGHLDQVGTRMAAVLGPDRGVLGPQRRVRTGPEGATRPSPATRTGPTGATGPSPAIQRGSNNPYLRLLEVPPMGSNNPYLRSLEVPPMGSNNPYRRLVEASAVPQRVSVPADGLCLLYSAVVTRPDLVLDRLLDRMPDHPILADRAVLDWLTDPARIRQDAVDQRRLVSEEGGAVDAGHPLVRTARALADLVDESLLTAELPLEAIRTYRLNRTFEAGNDGPLTPEEIADLREAVGNWPDRWQTDRGETFPPLLAHALGVRLTIHAGHTHTFGPGGAPVLDVHRGSDHFDASAPTGETVPDPSDPRLNPLFVQLADVRPGQLDRWQRWRYTVDTDGNVRLGARDARTALSPADRARLLAGMREAAARRGEAGITDAEFDAMLTGHDSGIAAGFDATGRTVAATIQDSGDLVWNRSANRWEIDASGSGAAIALRLSEHLGEPVAVSGVAGLARGADGRWRAGGRELAPAGDSLVLVSPDDLARMSPGRRAPDGAGFTVLAHFEDDRLRFGDVLLTAGELHRVLAATVPPDRLVTLVACSSGAPGTTFAQRLADLRGGDVLAPAADVVVGAPSSPDMPLTVGEEPWTLFRPATRETGGVSDDGWDVLNDPGEDGTAVPFAGVVSRAPETEDPGGVRLAKLRRKTANQAVPAVPAAVSPGRVPNPGTLSALPALYLNHPHLLHDLVRVEDRERIGEEILGRVEALLTERATPTWRTRTAMTYDAVNVDDLRFAIENEPGAFYARGGRSFDVRARNGVWYRATVEATWDAADARVIRQTGDKAKFDTRIDVASGERQSGTSGETGGLAFGVVLPAVAGAGGGFGAEVATARPLVTTEAGTRLADSRNMRSGDKSHLVRVPVDYTVTLSEVRDRLPVPNVQAPNAQAPDAQVPAVAPIRSHAILRAVDDLGLEPATAAGPRARDDQWAPVASARQTALLVENMIPQRILGGGFDLPAGSPRANATADWNTVVEDALRHLGVTKTVDPGSFGAAAVRDQFSERGLLATLMSSVDGPLHLPLVTSEHGAHALSLRVRAEAVEARAVADVPKSSFRVQPALTTSSRVTHSSRVGASVFGIPIRWGFPGAYVQARVSAGFFRTIGAAENRSSTTRAGTEFKDVANVAVETRLRLTVTPALREVPLSRLPWNGNTAGEFTMDVVVLGRMPADKFGALLVSAPPRPVANTAGVKFVPPYAHRGGRSVLSGLNDFDGLRDDVTDLVRRFPGGFLPRFDRDPGTRSMIGTRAAEERRRNQAALDRVLQAAAQRQTHASLMKEGLTAVLVREKKWGTRRVHVHVRGAYVGGLTHRGTDVKVGVRSSRADGTQHRLVAGGQHRFAAGVEGGGVFRWLTEKATGAGTASAGAEGRYRTQRQGGSQLSGQETRLNGGTLDSEAFGGRLRLTVEVQAYSVQWGRDRRSRLGIARTVKPLDAREPRAVPARPAARLHGRRGPGGSRLPFYRLGDTRNVTVSFDRSTVADHEQERRDATLTRSRDPLNLDRGTALDLGRMRDWVDGPDDRGTGARARDVEVRDWVSVESMPGSERIHEMARSVIARAQINPSRVSGSRVSGSRLDGLFGVDDLAPGMPLTSALTERVADGEQVGGLRSMLRDAWIVDDLTPGGHGTRVDLAVSATLVNPEIVAVHGPILSEAAGASGVEVSGERSGEVQVAARAGVAFNARKPGNSQTPTGGGLALNAGYEYLPYAGGTRESHTVAGSIERTINNRKGEARTFLVKFDMRVAVGAEVTTYPVSWRSLIPSALRSGTWLEHKKSIHERGVVGNAVYLRLTAEEAQRLGVIGRLNGDGEGFGHAWRPAALPAATEMRLPPGRGLGLGVYTFHDAPSLGASMARELENNAPARADRTWTQTIRAGLRGRLGGTSIEQVAGTMRHDGIDDPMLNRRRLRDLLTREGVQQHFAAMLDGGVPVLHVRPAGLVHDPREIRLVAELTAEPELVGFVASTDDADVKTTLLRDESEVRQRSHGHAVTVGAVATGVANQQGNNVALGLGEGFGYGTQVTGARSTGGNALDSNSSSGRGVKARVRLRADFRLVAYHRGVAEVLATVPGVVEQDRWADDMRLAREPGAVPPRPVGYDVRPGAELPAGEGWTRSNGLPVPPRFAPEDIQDVVRIQDAVAEQMAGAAKRLGTAGYAGAHQIRQSLSPDILLPGVGQMLTEGGFVLPTAVSAQFFGQRATVTVRLVPEAVTLGGVSTGVYREHAPQTSSGYSSGTSTQEQTSRAPRGVIGRGFVDHPEQLLGSTNPGLAAGETHGSAESGAGTTARSHNVKPEGPSATVDYLSRVEVTVERAGVLGTSALGSGAPVAPRAPQTRDLVNVSVRTGLDEARVVLDLADPADPADPALPDSPDREEARTRLRDIVTHEEALAGEAATFLQAAENLEKARFTGHDRRLDRFGQVTTRAKASADLPGLIALRDAAANAWWTSEQEHWNRLDGFGHLGLAPVEGRRHTTEALLNHVSRMARRPVRRPAGAPGYGAGSGGQGPGGQGPGGGPDPEHGGGGLHGDGLGDADHAGEDDLVELHRMAGDYFGDGDGGGDGGGRGEGGDGGNGEGGGDAGSGDGHGHGDEGHGDGGDGDEGVGLDRMLGGGHADGYRHLYALIVTDPELVRRSLAEAGAFADRAGLEDFLRDRGRVVAESERYRSVPGDSPLHQVADLLLELTRFHVENLRPALLPADVTAHFRDPETDRQLTRHLPEMDEHDMTGLLTYWGVRFDEGASVDDRRALVAQRLGGDRPLVQGEMTALARSLHTWNRDSREEYGLRRLPLIADALGVPIVLHRVGRAAGPPEIMGRIRPDGATLEIVHGLSGVYYGVRSARPQPPADRPQPPADRPQSPGDRSQPPGDRPQHPSDHSQTPGDQSRQQGDALPAGATLEPVPADAHRQLYAIIAAAPERVTETLRSQQLLNQASRELLRDPDATLREIRHWRGLEVRDHRGLIPEASPLSSAADRLAHLLRRRAGALTGETVAVRTIRALRPEAARPEDGQPEGTRPLTDDDLRHVRAVLGSRPERFTVPVGEALLPLLADVLGARIVVHGPGGVIDVEGQPDAPAVHLYRDGENWSAVRTPSVAAPERNPRPVPVAAIHLIDTPFGRSKSRKRRDGDEKP